MFLFKKRPAPEIAPPPPQRPVRTVFLDRDGVLNEKMPEGLYVIRWPDFHVLPGVPEAIKKLNDAGVRVVVVTNQRGVALGIYTLADVEALHDSFQRLLEGYGARIDAIFVCPHQKGACNCRKPLPGLFEQAVAQFPQITAAESVMIGDTLSDIEFGRNLGMRTILIEQAPGAQEVPNFAEARTLAGQSFNSLAQAVDALLSRET